jgi:hypothetical protein
LRPLVGAEPAGQRLEAGIVGPQQVTRDTEMLLEKGGLVGEDPGQERSVVDREVVGVVLPSDAEGCTTGDQHSVCVVELAARRIRGIPTGFGAGDGDHRDASWRADDRHVPSAAAGDHAQEILRDGGRQP